MKLLLAIILSVFLSSTIAPRITEAEPFNHMNCQYPTRATNPPNGCDNSDPACPAEIKGGLCEVEPIPAPKQELRVDSGCYE